MPEHKSAEGDCGGVRGGAGYLKKKGAEESSYHILKEEDRWLPGEIVQGPFDET